MSAWLHSVRAMRETDVAAVIEIAAVVPTAPHWPVVEFYRMLKMTGDQPTRRGAWVATAAEAVIGFAMASHVAGAAELEAVVTAPTHRQKGIGGALVDAVAGWARTAGAERLLLEVRTSNAVALRLYARQGFVRDGVRRGYYRSPDEDAVLLSLSL